MRYFYLLELWHSLEEYRLKNGQKFASFLKNLVSILLIKLQNFWLKKNFISITLLTLMSLSLFWRSFEVGLHGNFLKLNLFDNSKNFFSPLDYALNFFANVSDNFHINQVLLAEIIFNLLGVLLAFFCSFNLSRSLISNDLRTKNILLFSLIFCYFCGLSLKMFSFQIVLLKAIVIVYISLSLRENVKSSFFINIITIGCGLLLVLIRWQLVFLLLAFELMQFFSLKKELVKYCDEEFGIFFVKIRYSLNLIARILLTSCILAVLMINKKILNLHDIFEQIKQFNFENYKFFSSQLVNRLYRESNSQGFFAVLSNEILLFFFTLIIFFMTNCNHKLFYALSAIDFLKQFLTIFFIASFATLLLIGYDDKVLKLLFININSFLVFMVFFKSLIANKFNFKKHAIVLLIFISLALGDFYVFFEVIFYLPFLWFIIHLIFLKRIAKKLPTKTIYNDLNQLDNFFLLRSLYSKIIFILLITLICFWAFYFNFFLLWLFNTAIFCYLLVFFEKINYKILKNYQYHFLTSLTIFLAITYLVILSFKGFDLSGHRQNSFFTYQRNILNGSIANKLSKFVKQEDEIVIIDEQNVIDRNSLIAKTNILEKNIFFKNNFIISEELSKLTNKKNKFFIINNSFIFNNKSCLISKFEQLMRDNEFKDYYFKNPKELVQYKVSQNLLKNYSFYNNKIDNINLEENFLIYDFILLLRL
ncbi:MAG: hypothetical protein ACKO47_01940 [Alphaproteobacteria bacterium]